MSHTPSSEDEHASILDTKINKLLRPIDKQLDSYPERVQKQLRKGMRSLMSESYIAGSHDCQDVLIGDGNEKSSSFPAGCPEL